MSLLIGQLGANQRADKRWIVTGLPTSEPQNGGLKRTLWILRRTCFWGCSIHSIWAGELNHSPITVWPPSALLSYCIDSNYVCRLWTKKTTHKSQCGAQWQNNTIKEQESKSPVRGPQRSVTVPDQSGLNCVTLPSSELLSRTSGDKRNIY